MGRGGSRGRMTGGLLSSCSHTQETLSLFLSTIISQLSNSLFLFLSRGALFFLFLTFISGLYSSRLYSPCSLWPFRFCPIVFLPPIYHLPSPILPFLSPPCSSSLPPPLSLATQPPLAPPTSQGGRGESLTSCASVLSSNIMMEREREHSGPLTLSQRKYDILR